jgi:hypothetical protein
VQHGNKERLNKCGHSILGIPIKRDFGLKIPSTVLNNIFVVVVIAEMLKFIEPVDH